jgi:uncharacterized membrane protein
MQQVTRAGEAPSLMAPVVRPTHRIASVDIVRGTVMVLMALDHVRDWVTNVRFQPEDLSRSWAALFFTRWVTHFCAPTFFLLAGVGIGILASRGKRPSELTRFLLIRGVWLLVLELVITPVGWQFGFQLIPAFALVLWALGLSMIIMAAVVHLPRPAIAAGAVVMIAGHNQLDGIRADSLGGFAGIWRVLHVPGFVVPGVLFVCYPLVPWVAVMAAGFLLARVYALQPGARRSLLLWMGAAVTLTFVVLRFLNLYGAPAPWASQRTTLLTIASFLNVRKYPPSLLFLLMTIGPALIALSAAEGARGRLARWLSVYGRVPLFFYVTHIFVAHAAAMLLAFLQSGQIRRIKVITDIGSLPEWYGVSLVGVYVTWVMVVLLMYFPCRRFATLKDARSRWWLQYL